MGVANRVGESWRHFKKSRPGRRFQDRYHRRQEVRDGGSVYWKAINALLGVVVILAGLVAVPAPGPGWLIVFFGLGVIAGEFLPVARSLDRAETRLRELLWWSGSLWKRLSPLARGLILLAALLCVALFGYGAYLVVFGGAGG